MRNDAMLTGIIAMSMWWAHPNAFAEEAGKVSVESLILEALGEVRIMSERNDEVLSQINNLKKTVAELLRARIECVTVTSNGPSASCPSEYTVVACSLGNNQGSYDIDQPQGANSCADQGADSGWTKARCCRVQF